MASSKTIFEQQIEYALIHNVECFKQQILDQINGHTYGQVVRLKLEIVFNNPSNRFNLKLASLIGKAFDFTNMCYNTIYSFTSRTPSEGMLDRLNSLTIVRYEVLDTTIEHRIFSALYAQVGRSYGDRGLNEMTCHAYYHQNTSEEGPMDDDCVTVEDIVEERQRDYSHFAGDEIFTQVRPF